jgi:hypothetical protein
MHEECRSERLWCSAAIIMTCRGPAISVTGTGSIQRVRFMPATLEHNTKTTQKMAATLHEDLHAFLITSRSLILTMRHVSDKICTHFVVNNFSLNNHATDGNIIRGMRFACYKHTLRICNTYCFSTATMVSWKRFNVMLYVHSLS